MYKLYGINSYTISRDEQNCVVVALDEEDAVNEFYKDLNHRMYNKISSIYEIESNKCIVYYQYANEILDLKETEYDLVDVRIGESVWGDNAFTIKVKNISDKIKELDFKENFIHSENNRLVVMVCVYDWRPNWIH